ncbi:unnamed protein product [Closterium sp. NIES-64]|nr:unnamed protein product [Closterium sp. NIES-64]
MQRRMGKDISHLSPLSPRPFLPPPLPPPLSISAPPSSLRAPPHLSPLLPSPPFALPSPLPLTPPALPSSSPAFPSSPSRSPLLVSHSPLITFFSPIILFPPPPHHYYSHLLSFLFVPNPPSPPLGHLQPWSPLIFPSLFPLPFPSLPPPAAYLSSPPHLPLHCLASPSQLHIPIPRQLQAWSQP